MKRVAIKGKKSAKLKEGYPLIHQTDLVQPVQTTDWVQFESQNEVIGVGYLGEQNKGSGWIIDTTDNMIRLKTFVQLWQRALKRRQSFFEQQMMTNAFRLFNGEGDGMGGMTADYYDGFVVFSWYNATIYQHRAEIIQALNEVFPTIKGMYEKIRFESKMAVSHHIQGETAPEPLIIRENGVQYATYLDDGWMTGIFLDQKEVRGRLVDGFACGKKVLNLFSYTGAFSIAAAMGGAYQTVSVDLARRSLNKTKENFEINGFNPADHEIRVMDVFEYVRWAQKKGITFDMIVLDPPSFARNGKKTFSVAHDYGRLVESVLPLLVPGGELIASTNAANVSLAKYQQMIQQAMVKMNRSFTKQSIDRLPSDFTVFPHFKEGNYLKVITYEVNKSD